MKIAYVDETGTDGKSPLLVMVGVIADTVRIRRTQDEFAWLFTDLSEVATKALKELKASDLHKGNGSWRDVPGEKRREMISMLCEWLVDRKHFLALAAIDLDKWPKRAPADLPDAWLGAALHTALQIQRCHQKIEKGKGMTFLVFDEHKQKADAVAELLYAPPSWTDEYYERPKKAQALDQILDTAFYAKSHHVGLVQIADLFAFVFRRYAELTDYAHAEAFVGEADLVGGWVQCLGPRLLDKAHRWPARPKNAAAQMYVDVAPRSLLGLG